MIAVVDDFNEFENQNTREKYEIENSTRMNNELSIKLDIERNILYTAISNKEREISELEFLVTQKLPSEFSNFEFLFKKELEIHNKSKTENNQLLSKNENLTKELREMIKIYKDTACIDLEKTKEGYLKLTFFKGLM